MAEPNPSVNNPFLSLLQTLKPQLDADIERLLAQEVLAQRGVGREVEMMLEAAQVLCAGGKRLRAGLLVAGHYAFAASPSRRTGRPLRRVAVALELLQAYFLIHDDWMDQDETRRGVPAVHAALSKQFHSAHLGACGAVLAGDYLVTLSCREFYSVAVTQAQVKPLLDSFNGMQLAAIAGQQLDVVGLTQDALKVYELKTGSYTVSGPLVLGALLAGADAQAIRRLKAFALPVGLAFQLRDDLLSLFADPARTGKALAGDIIEGKWTWLAQWVLEHGTSAQQRRFRAAFANSKASSSQVQSAIDAVEKSGARSAAETQIGQWRATATKRLATLNLSANATSMLQGAVSALIDRDF